MKKYLILSALLATALTVNAQPGQPVPESKADRSTVEFVVRDGKPLITPPAALRAAVPRVLRNSK